MKKTLLVAVMLFSAAPLFGQVKFRDVADEDIDRAIEAAQRYLFGQQQEDGKWFDWNRDVTASGGGGGVPHTAIAIFALMEMGLDDQEAHIKKGLEWLCKQEIKNTYSAAVRVMILSQVIRKNPNSPYKKVLKDDIDFLSKDFAKCGAWDYPGASKDGDNSCSQFALLAMWEADMAKQEIPAQVFRLAESTWVRRVRPDGGWIYAGQPDIKADSTASMTAAALASLYQCQDVLAVGGGPYQHKAVVDKGWKFLAKALKEYKATAKAKTGKEEDWFQDRYLAFCLQRVGMASGMKFIDDLDWFADAATKYAEANPQGRTYNDKYGPIVGASLELIFLARSRLPMTYNKLEYGAEAQWNTYPRDVPRFTEWMRRQFEMRMRWQVVRLADDVRLMLDAPTLLMEGSAALTLTDAEKDKLREYTLRGGTLVMVANNGSQAFVKSAEALLSDLYKEQQKQSGKYYKVEKLTEAHPIYDNPSDANFTKIDGGSGRAPISGVSDGTRLIALVCQRDIPKSWQDRAFGDKLDFPLAKNLLFYSTGGNSISRLRPVFVAKPGPVKTTVATIGWVKHDGNWGTSPFALKSLAEKINAENRIDVKVTEGVDLAKDKLDGFKLLWITGSEDFNFTDAEMKALRNYIDGGGMIFVNAVGGSHAFRDAARTMLEKLFENSENLTTGYASAASPFMTGVCGDERGPQVKKLDRTAAWKKGEPKVQGVMLQVYEENGRPAAVFCAYGIHDTLDGHMAHGATSYQPATARELAANLLLTSLMPATAWPKPAPKAPASAPATASAPASTPATAP